VTLRRRPEKQRQMADLIVLSLANFAEPVNLFGNNMDRREILKPESKAGLRTG
jgi:hypothetical protein